MSEKFDIYSKIFFRDVENFVRHLCVLVLRHQMRVSNYFVNSFYSVGGLGIITNGTIYYGGVLGITTNGIYSFISASDFKGWLDYYRLTYQL